MRILTRYVLREFLVPLFYCLAGFVSIYVLFELFGSFSRLASSQLPLKTIVSYFFAYLAPYFEWLAPAALMLAALYTMWGFCRHSELIAMRASGVGFLAIVRPMLAVATMMAALVWWVNDRYVPAKAQWARQLRSAHFDVAKMTRGADFCYRNAERTRTWSADSVEDRAATRLAGVKIAVTRPDSAMREMTIRAARAEYLDGVWWLTDPSVQHYGADGSEIATPCPELDALTLRAFPEFTETPADFVTVNRDWAYNSTRDRFHFLGTNTSISSEQRAKYLYDTWAKVFAPLACLIITLFAIPAGVATGRQSVFKGILGALGMFFAFYALTIVCMILANAELLPPLIAAVVPHVVFSVLGLRLFWRQR